MTGAEESWLLPADAPSERQHPQPPMGCEEVIELPAGTILQETYRILARVGSGSTGQVYAATHGRLAALVAIKLLRSAVVDRAETLRRFYREAAIMSRLHHPNIVQVFDLNRTPQGTPYLVMEYFDGGNLAEELERRGPLPLDEALAIVKQIAGGLAAAHAQGIVHRDLKPQNVMVQHAPGYGLFVKILDFGLSSAPWAGRLTLERVAMGTPNYMSPEQASGCAEDVGPCSDQFALAAIAYELLTGVAAFGGESAIAVLYQVVHARPAPLAASVSWPAAKVESVLLRGLAKVGRDRFPTILGFAEALCAAAAEAGPPVPTDTAFSTAELAWFARAWVTRDRGLPYCASSSL